MCERDPQQRPFREWGIGLFLAPQVYGDVLEGRLNRQGLSMLDRVSPYEGAASASYELLTRELAGPWESAFSWWGDHRKDDGTREGHIHWPRTGNRWRVLSSDPRLLQLLDDLECRQVQVLSLLVAETEAKVEAKVEAAGYAGRRWEIAQDLADVGKAMVYRLHTLEGMGLVDLYLQHDWMRRYGYRLKGDDIGDRELEQLKGLPKRTRNQSVNGKIVVKGEMLTEFLAKLMEAGKPSASMEQGT